MKNRMKTLLLLSVVMLLSFVPGEKLLAAEDDMSEDYTEDDDSYDDEDYDDDYDDDDEEDYDDDDYELEVGDGFTASNGYEYEVLTINGSKGTAMLTGTESSKITKLNVPSKTEDEDFGYTFTVTAIDEEAFEGYKKLKTVKIPDTVTSIGEEAFVNCKALTSVTIGKKVTTIGKKAFYNDKKLENIKITSSKLKKVGSKAFARISKKCVFKVPASKLKAYQKLLQKQGTADTVVFKKA